MPESKKVVISVDIHDENCKRKALKAVSGLSGIESLATDMKDKKLTIIGDVDPVDIVEKLKKWNPGIVTVGPAKEEKKTEPEKKKNEEEEKMKKKRQEEEEAIRRSIEAYWLYYPYMTQGYCVHSVEDDPIGCVIC